MCLLDTVIRWDMDTIHCMTDTHRNPANPLRYQGRLAALHAFEYGAQAAALHGSLCAQQQEQTAPPGYLAALHDAQWFVAELSDIASALDVTARAVLFDSGYCIYRIQVSTENSVLAKARITIAPRPPNGLDS